MTLAELVFGVTHEGAHDVDDLLDRRTRVGMVAADRAAPSPPRSRASTLATGNDSLNSPPTLPKRSAPAPTVVSMLEPRGADSSTSSNLRRTTPPVLNHARDALCRAASLTPWTWSTSARHDEGLDEPARASLALTGLLAQLAVGDLRGASAYSRDLTNLMRVRGVVGAMSSFGLGEFAAARSQDDQAVSYYERAGEELAASDVYVWLPWRSGMARVIAGRGEIAAAAALVEEELADARTFDSTYAVAYALRTQAAIAPTDDRAALLDEALEVLHGTGAARLEAQIRTDLAGWILLLQPDASPRAIDLLRSRRRSTPGRRSSVRCCLACAGCSSGSARRPTASSPAGWPS